MAAARLRGSLVRWGSALGALSLAAVASVTLRGEEADACGWSGPSVEDLTTFDPRIAEGEIADALYYNPYQAGWGELCDSCVSQALRDDWQGYLGKAVTADDWDAILFRAQPDELKQLSEQLGGKRAAVPAAYARSSLWKDASARPKLRAAVELVRLVRAVEQTANAGRYQEPAYDGAAGVPGGVSGAGGAAGKAKPRATPKQDLVATAKAGLKAAAKDPFLAQRYAFAMVRALFYEKRYDEVIAAVEAQATALAAPSSALKWRARYYLAGALMRTRQRARGNLELARIHAGSWELAGPAANDFRPMEEADWRESLRLAGATKDATKDKVALWRLIGVTRDGVVAMREIQKLDARSPLLALLMVRELERSEGRDSVWWDGPKDAAVAARQKRELAALEQLAASIAATPGADRPWLMTLIAGHLAAKRGDLAAAKRQLLAALAARPGDERVKTQVHASLAMALVVDARDGGGPANQKLAKAPTAERANAVAAEMLQVSKDFARLGKLREEVRGTLASAYLAAGKLVEAELLRPGLLEGQPGTADKWKDVSFLKAMIAQASKQRTPFEKFLVESSYSRPQLEAELALRYLTSGSFAEAAKIFASGNAASGKLGTNPFTMPLVDCHDCDHERYAEAPWTHANFAARLVELEKQAGGKGESAASAALELGIALYNITWYGNARVVLADTHQKLEAPRAAERWFKRAFELSRDRERRAKAAFFAAKAELGTLISAAQDAAAMNDWDHIYLSELPVPKTWFPVLESFADTAYYQEVLAECGNFRGWAARAK